MAVPEGPGPDWLQGLPPMVQAWVSLGFAIGMMLVGFVGYRKNRQAQPGGSDDGDLRVAGALIDGKQAKTLTESMNRLAAAMERSNSLASAEQERLLERNRRDEMQDLLEVAVREIRADLEKEMRRG